MSRDTKGKNTTTIQSGRHGDLMILKTSALDGQGLGAFQAGNVFACKTFPGHIHGAQSIAGGSAIEGEALQSGFGCIPGWDFFSLCIKGCLQAAMNVWAHSELEMFFAYKTFLGQMDRPKRSKGKCKGKGMKLVGRGKELRETFNFQEIKIIFSQFIHHDQIPTHVYQRARRQFHQQGWLFSAHKHPRQ